MKMSTVQEDILTYWLDACPSDDGLFPSRQQMKVTDLRSRMAHVAVMDVEQDPLDFRYRLIGTKLREFLYADYTGQSFRELKGKEPGSEIWTIVEQVYRDQTPLYCEVPYVGPKADYKQASSLYLPLASDNRTIDKIMLVSNFVLIDQIDYDTEFDPADTRIIPLAWRERQGYG